MKDIADFVAGFKRFQERYFSDDRDLFERLGRGQRPQAMIVACADSRVDPALLCYNPARNAFEPVAADSPGLPAGPRSAAFPAQSR